MLPTGRLAVEAARLRARVEALERLAAESRQAEEERRESEERVQRAEADRRTRETDLLAHLAGEINASLDLDTVLQKVADGARDLCDGDVAGIALREPDSDSMVFRHWAGVRTVSPRTFRVASGTGLAARVLTTGRPLRSEHYAADPRISKDYVDLAEMETITALMAVPIRVGPRIEGLIYVGNRDARAFTDGDESRVTRLADHAGLAIQNAREFRSHQRTVDELAVLYDVAAAASAGADPPALFGPIQRALTPIMDVRQMLVLLHDTARRDLEVVFSARAAAPPHGAAVPAVGARVPMGVGLATRVLERRAPLRTSDYAETCRLEGVEPSPLAAGFAHSLGVPLIGGAAALGVLVVWGARRPFSRADERLLATVGGLASLALRLMPRHD